jgi:hypothetical protein
MRVRIKGVWYDAESTPILIQPNENDLENLNAITDNHQSYLCFPEKLTLDEALIDLGLKLEEGKLLTIGVEEEGDGKISTHKH